MHQLSGRRAVIVLALATCAACVVAGWWILIAPSIVKPPAAVEYPVLTTPNLRTEAESVREKLDPRGSGWDSEVFAEAADLQLKKLAELLTASRIQAAALKRVAVDECQVSVLRPNENQEVFADETVVVRRADDVDAAGFAGRGVEAMAASLNELAGTYADGRCGLVKFKVIHVELSVNKATTTVRFEASGKTAQGMLQQTATWQCQWQRSEPPLLSSVALRRYEEVEARGPSVPWFADATQAVLGGNRAFHQQLSYGINHWLRHIERAHGMFYFNRHGLAVGDANGDGLDDVYVCQPGGLPNRLFVQAADGTAADVSKEAGVDWLDHTASALLVDLDNDGDQDLVLATSEGVQLLANNGSARFQLRSALSCGDDDLHGLSAIDYDHDGDLDLYVTADHASAETRLSERLPPFQYQDANDGGINRLFRNDSATRKDWTFTDATKSSGLDSHNRRHSLAAAWEDFDNDGDQDLYVANDYGQNCLYRNELVPSGTARFVEIAVSSGVVDYGSGMSVSWGDFDRDGRMDLYVGNMFSSAGNRITAQHNFMALADNRARTLMRRFTKGNTLFRNQGNGRFEEVADSGAEMARWAWSSLFVDLNNDGWDDLLAANGYITTRDTGDL